VFGLIPVRAVEIFPTKELLAAPPPTDEESIENKRPVVPASVALRIEFK
jgi:hypothetical protein